MSYQLSATSRVFINSETDRQIGQTSGFFTALLPKPLQYPKKVRVIGATIPYFFPSFTTLNNTLNVNIGGTPYTISIPTNQNFDGTLLANFLGTQLTALGAGVFTATFFTTTGFITITGPATAWQILPTSTCLGKIGFSSGNLVASLISGLYRLSGDLPVNTLRTQNIYILSSIVSGQGMNADPNNTKYNILYKIPVNTGYFGVIANQSQFIEASYNLFQNALDSIDIQLVDDDYNILNLPDNLYWTLELNFDY
jgi:hypothetical protein